MYHRSQLILLLPIHNCNFWSTPPIHFKVSSPILDDDHRNGRTRQHFSKAILQLCTIYFIYLFCDMIHDFGCRTPWRDSIDRKNRHDVIIWHMFDMHLMTCWRPQTWAWYFLRAGSALLLMIIVSLMSTMMPNFFFKKSLGQRWWLVVGFCEVWFEGTCTNQTHLSKSTSPWHSMIVILHIIVIQNDLQYIIGDPFQIHDFFEPNAEYGSKGLSIVHPAWWTFFVSVVLVFVHVPSVVPFRIRLCVW